MAKKKSSIAIDEINEVYRSSNKVTDKQLDRLQADFGAELPRGYRNFLKRFGHGWLNDWFQIYCPDKKQMLAQRQTIVEDFNQEIRLRSMEFQGAKLKEDDINSCIQIAIDQDVTRVFACPRFPGSVFTMSYLTTKQYKTGFENLAPFLGGDPQAYFVPLKPTAKHDSYACQSKKVQVDDVVDAIQDLVPGDVKVVPVDEGGGELIAPGFWLFPEKLGVKFYVFCLETEKYRRVYLKFCTSQKLLPKIETLIEKVAVSVGVKFKRASC